MERIMTNLYRKWIDNINEDIEILARVIRKDEYVNRCNNAGSEGTCRGRVPFSLSLLLILLLPYVVANLCDLITFWAVF